MGGHSLGLSAVEARWLIDEAQRLIDTLEPRAIANRRDRAIIGIMGYAWAPVDAVLAMQVRDYYWVGDRRWVRLREQGIERHEIVDRRLEPYIDEYLAAAQITHEPRTPLFRSTLSGKRRFGARPVARRYILELIQQLTQQAVTPRRDEVMESKTSERLRDAQFDKVINSIKANSVIAHRDLAIIGLMLYASLSPKIISKMLTSNYKVLKGQYYIRLDDCNTTIAAAPALAALLREYLAAARLRKIGNVPLFSTDRNVPMTVPDIHKMVRRRMRQAGLARLSSLQA